jgi:hypothetical protein
VEGFATPEELAIEHGVHRVTFYHWIVGLPRYRKMVGSRRVFLKRSDVEKRLAEMVLIPDAAARKKLLAATAKRKRRP